jgi:hypothetical protein
MKLLRFCAGKGNSHEIRKLDPPHAINLNDGTVFAPSGEIARVTSSYSRFDENGIAAVTFGEISGLPSPEKGVIYIVSGLVAAAAKRKDVVSPATAHPECVRKEGQVVSVPGFIRS